MISVDSAVDDYVARVDKALRDLPRSRRAEIVSEIAEHARMSVAELQSPTESDVRNVLDRIGDPADIAAEARERFGIREGLAATWREPTALVLLFVGWLIPGVGTLIALILLWTSRVWSGRQKLAATLVMPGTLLLPVAFTIGLRSDSGGCPVPTADQNPAPCGPSGGGGVGPFEIVVLLLVFLAIGAVSASLIRSIRQSRRVG
jgi:hypothetical protein